MPRNINTPEIEAFIELEWSVRGRCVNIFHLQDPLVNDINTRKRCSFCRICTLPCHRPICALLRGSRDRRGQDLVSIRDRSSSAGSVVGSFEGATAFTRRQISSHLTLVSSAIAQTAFWSLITSYKRNMARDCELENIWGVKQASQLALLFARDRCCCCC